MTRANGVTLVTRVGTEGQPTPDVLYKCNRQQGKPSAVSSPRGVQANPGLEFSLAIAQQRSDTTEQTLPSITLGLLTPRRSSVLGACRGFLRSVVSDCEIAPTSSEHSAAVSFFVFVSAGYRRNTYHTSKESLWATSH